MGRRLNQLASHFTLLPWLIACAPAAATSGPEHPAAAHDEPSSMATKTESETAQPKAPRADLLYQAHPAVPAPAPSCVQGTALPPRGACSEPRADLAEALAQPGAERDSALAALERCDAFETGLIRALRADLGPAECADV